MATRWYADPIVDVLRALGVMFASPPAGSTNMAGVVFNESNEPTGIQTPAGNVVDFPGGNGIPNPANNFGADVQIYTAPGGSIQIGAVGSEVGTPGGVDISAASGTGSGQIGGSIAIAAGAGGPASDGGGLSLNAGGGDEENTSGAGINLTGGTGAGDIGGDLELLVGSGSSANGALRLSSVNTDLGVATAAGTVTAGSVGPVNVELSRWIPVTLDGVAGFVAFYTPVA